MTPENKLLLKRIALFVGIAAILATVIVLIVQNNKYKRDAEKAEENSDASPPKPTSTGTSGGSSSGGSSTNTLNGRTFTKTEIEKMQTLMAFIGYMKQNQFIQSSIAETGGIDGKIGEGFKEALAECIRIGAVKDLDDLYYAAVIRN